MNLNRYKARDLLNLSYDDLWSLPSEWHLIEFDDGKTVVSVDRITKLSVLCWYPLKHYKDCPIPSDHHIDFNRILTDNPKDYLNVEGGRVTSKAMVKHLNKAIWNIYDWSGETVDPEVLSKLAIEGKNWLYNQTTVKLSEYLATLSMFDIAEVYNHPKVREANHNIEPTTYGIEKISYGKVKEVFNDPTQFIGNSIIEGLRSGTQKTEQLLQAFAWRGFPTDINSDIFKYPVTTGYIDGIWNLYENMIESRSGTKALLYNKELLRVTEYFNRKSQLIAQYVQRLHPGDCKTTILAEYPVTKLTLKAFKGKYYQKEDGKLDWIHGNETHLIGTKQKFRSVFGCNHPDSQGICMTCYGRLGINIPKGTNIGQVAAVSMGDKITSAVLSTKHTDASSAVEQYKLGKIESNYLRTGEIPETLYLKKELTQKDYRLVIARSEAENLADILMIDDLTAYPATSATELTSLALVYDDEVNGECGDVLTVSLYNRRASLSIEMLKHIKMVRWELDQRDNIVISLRGFDFNLPFLTLPNKHVNMYEVMKRFQSFLHSGSDSAEAGKLSTEKVGYTSKTYLKNYKSPIEALPVFATMANEKISLNISHCEILIYAMMIRSAQYRDYRLPKPGINGQFEKYNRLMQCRSLGGAMAFEKQHEPLNNPGSFLNKMRNDHPYDLLVKGGKLL
ncbi:hypothetical protein RVBP20_0980 [Pseudomonas phage sp. NK1]|nr:hypothetical protein RVBP20_0980 [Pseudomonas phage sp. NK1]